MEQVDWTLLTRYLKGGGSAAERRRFEEWMRGHPEREAFVREMRRLWRGGAVPPLDHPRPSQYLEADWAHLRAKMQAPNDDPARPAGADRSSEPSPRSNRPSRPRRAGRRRAGSWQLLRVAAVVLVIAGIAFLFARRFERPDTVPAAPETALRAAATGPGQRARLFLSDGTHVRLNVGSRLRYPQVFTTGRREVYLSGEAYFEVASDSLHPFIIHAGGAVVRVRGTAFEIRAYEEEDEVEVVVTEGVVALLGKRGAVALSQHTLGRYAGGRVERVATGVDPARYLAWMEGRLLFVDTPLRVVAVELERWYDVAIHIEGAELAGRRLTATFSDEPLDAVLQVVAAALEATCEREGARVTFRLDEGRNAM